MRRAKVLLVAVMTVPLAACLLDGKPRTVAATPAPPKPVAPAPPPAEPLSIPQTNVALPAPQPLPEGALNTNPPPPEPEPETPAKPVSQPAKPQRPGAPLPKTPDQPPAAEPEQPTRDLIQEVLKPDEKNRLLDSAHAHQAETRLLMAGVNPKTPDQQRAKAEIDQFLQQSKQAEDNGDMRMADQLAERASILAKELRSGK